MMNIKQLREKYNSPVWVSQDGDMTPLAIMSKRYMQNICRFLSRTVNSVSEMERWLDHPFWGFDEDSYMHAEQALEAAYDEVIVASQWMQVLEDWYVKRGFGTKEEFQSLKEPVKSPPKVEHVNIFKIVR